MKKNKPKYLKLYYEWLQTRLPRRWGLCREFWDDGGCDPLLKMVSPTGKDIAALKRKRLNHEYWGSDNHNALYGDFTPLRQNIVLLMAALNNEL